MAFELEAVFSGLSMAVSVPMLWLVIDDPHTGTRDQWLAARRPVELHIYAKGGHGFGMRKQNLPADAWIERFGDWLHMQELLAK